jgi:hypothetical protein
MISIFALPKRKRGVEKVLCEGSGDVGFRVCKKLIFEIDFAGWK